MGYALTGPRQVAGVLAYSGLLFESFEMKHKGTYQENIGKIPILAYHGNMDDVLPYKKAKDLYDKHLI